MVRLLRRAQTGSVQPELFAALVQACRFCGLLEASVAAHERARQLDRHIVTPIEHTYWQLREYDWILEYVEHMPPGRVSLIHELMVAIVLGERGHRDDAVQRLREIEKGTLTDYVRSIVVSVRALFEGRREESLETAERVVAQFPDPEGVAWQARVLAYFGKGEGALAALERALDRGFISYRLLTREDPWLDPIRQSPRFKDLLEQAELQYRGAVSAFRKAGGEELLGVNVIESCRRREE